jgi:hypothetical protein
MAHSQKSFASRRLRSLRAKDILSDPFYVALERNYCQLAIILIQINIFFFAGLAAAAGRGLVA